MARERPDLKPLVGQKLIVIAWLWARTVKSPNPAFANLDVPLASTFMLSTKSGKETYIEPIIESGGYRFTVRVGKPKNAAAAKNGTKLAGANFVCLMSGSPISGDYIKAEGRAGRLGERLMAIVVEGQRGRIFVPPTRAMESIARDAEPEWKPDVEFFQHALGFRVGSYGMTKWSDLFTPRQLVALTTFSELVCEARPLVIRDAVVAGFPKSVTFLDAENTDVTAYADAVVAYLAFAVDKGANYWSSLCAWHQTRDGIVSTFGRQTIPIVWDYAEANPLSGSSGNILLGVEQASRMLQSLGLGLPGLAFQADAGNHRQGRVNRSSLLRQYRLR
jgi:putative DNA methylase